MSGSVGGGESNMKAKIKCRINGFNYSYCDDAIRLEGAAAVAALVPYFNRSKVKEHCFLLQSQGLRQEQTNMIKCIRQTNTALSLKSITFLNFYPEFGPFTRLHP